MELTRFGWNALTMGFLGTIFLTGVCAWGLWQQKKAIWRDPSCQSISIIWFCYVATIYLTGLIYGWSINSLALMFNGLVLGLFHIPILWGLWKFKGFSRLEKTFALCLSIVIITMIVTPWKDWFFLISIFGNIFFTLTQPYQIWKNKNAGVVEIKLLSVYLLNSAFWLIYSYAINDWVLKIVNPIGLITIILTIVVWYRYHKETKKQTVDSCP